MPPWYTPPVRCHCVVPSGVAFTEHSTAQQQEPGAAQAARAGWREGAKANCSRSCAGFVTPGTVPSQSGYVLLGPAGPRKPPYLMQDLGWDAGPPENADELLNFI